jgi:glycosyltransferase involved in cell wall biosynthesis
VQDVLAAADIGVLCSDREGTPLAVLEYMQAGLGIVATSVGGVPAVIRHEREGLLVAPGSPGELARALGRLSADTDLRETLGRAARERCRDRFGLDRFTRTLADIYRSLAGSGAHG